jgi:hypothetical protein
MQLDTPQRATTTETDATVWGEGGSQHWPLGRVRARACVMLVQCSCPTDFTMRCFLPSPAMPHAMLLLCERMTSALDAIATELSAKSGFVRDAAVPFHVPLLGSLHSYGKPEIGAALSSAASRSAPMAGRCIRWEVTRRTIRLLVELDGDQSIEENLQRRLPRGKTWKPRSITIGSIEAIEQTHHAAFLAAVEQAFPIVDASTFECAALANSDTPLVAVPLSGTTAPPATEKLEEQPPTLRPTVVAKKSTASANIAVPMDVVIEPRLVGINKKHRKGREVGGGAQHANKPSGGRPVVAPSQHPNKGRSNRFRGAGRCSR